MKINSNSIRFSCFKNSIQYNYSQHMNIANKSVKGGDSKYIFCFITNINGG